MRKDIITMSTKELKQLQDSGAVTIAQDRESSVVWGMPGEAHKIGAVQHVLPPNKIAEKLSKIIMG